MSCSRFDMPLGCGVYKVEPTLSHADGVTAPFERERAFNKVYAAWRRRLISGMSCLRIDMPLVQGVYKVEPTLSHADGVTAPF